MTDREPENVQMWSTLSKNAKGISYTLASLEDRRVVNAERAFKLLGEMTNEDMRMGLVELVEKDLLVVVGEKDHEYQFAEESFEAFVTKRLDESRPSSPFYKLPS